MSAPADVGLDEAHAFLRLHLGDDVADVELVGEGEWSRCFGFRHEDCELVIRFGHHLDDFEKDRRAAGFASAGLPVPRVHDIGTAFGGHFAISTRVHGAPLEQLDHRGWEVVLPSLLAVLDATRALDVPDGTGYGLWDGHGHAAHARWRDVLLSVDDDQPGARTRGWRARLGESPDAHATFRRGLERLLGVAEAGAGVRHVVHGDLINRNVLVAGDRITGVFDWGCSLHGDPLYDIAWLDLWSPWHTGLDAIDLRGTALRHLADAGVALDDAEARLLACSLHIGLAGLAYSALMGRADDIAAIRRRLVPLLD